MNEKNQKYFRDNSSYEDLGRASIESGIVLIAGRVINVFVQVGSTIVLARILGPVEFGLVALALALVIFSPIVVDFGTSDAVNQQEQITPEVISSLFWFNSIIGLALTAAFALSSQLIAALFSQPALAGIMLVVSLTFLFQALSVQHVSLMRRAMEFKSIVLVDTIANVVSSVVAIAMALMGWSYWSIAVKSVLSLLLVAIGTWILCPWLPGRPRMTAEFKKLVRFGSGVTGFGVADSIAWSLDRVALGYFYGPGPVGYYQNAFLLYSNALTVLTSSLHNVAISGLSKLRDNQDELKRSWFTGLSLVVFASALAFAALATTANDVVALLFGPKWAPTGPLLFAFALRGIAQGAERTLGWLHVVAGRSDRWLRWGVVSTLFQLAALAAGLPFGTMGVAVAYAVATFVLYVPALVYAGQPLGITSSDVFRATVPYMVAAIMTVILGSLVSSWLFSGVAPLVRLAAASIVCCAIYLFIVVIVFRTRRPVEVIALIGRELISKRSVSSWR